MGFLDEILPQVRSSVRDPRYRLGLPAKTDRPAPSLRRSIEEQAEHGGILVEFKRVSPGAELSRLPVRSIADLTESLTGTDIAGFSCLATRPTFEGGPEQVAELVGATALPVLFKDFVLDPVQIEVAQRVGASAILLIGRLETEGRMETSLAKLADLAHAARLEVVLEIHRREELASLSGITPDVYGVNARNLDSLALEPGVAEETIQALPTSRPLLAMSGIESTSQASRYWDLGVDGLLVGSAVARSRDPAAFVRSLFRTSVKRNR